MAALIAAIAGDLARAGIPDARIDARLLVGHALGLDRAGLLSSANRIVGPAELERIERLAARRLRREPVSRILGSREFWSLDFLLSPATLDPRPDSETIVEAALALSPDRDAPLRVLDLGVGTGCLLLAILSERPNAFGIGLDRSAEAAATARANAARLGLAGRAAMAVGDWGTPLEGTFDLIVSNPPYISAGDLGGLEPEVTLHDPPLALSGGRDGLDAYRAIAAQAPRLLGPGGWIVLEAGKGQAGDVSALLADAGLADIGVRNDLSSVPRAVFGQKTFGIGSEGR
ncbi:peptide chain release factor N(5)-glutamine methyltransferase [Inquilinus sp. CAU 1745]|uniref:peptide chain release factor N(5)-glutamine methyltransferase n=1 Tax=Inquilinus sp. CAU 1745 TaxID=3140369 RepID=UPI00325A6A66